MKRVVLFFVLGLLFAGPALAGQQKVRGYNVVLLLGDAQPSPMPEGLTPDARKALADIKDFLPFKGYHLLDMQWLAGADSGASVAGRLRGPNENQYLLFNAGLSELNQRFQLWTADRSALLLDTTFTMRPGETVVVGTSRVPGDKALVVLLTISGDEIFDVGAGVVAPRVLAPVPKPSYTPEAMRARIEGHVTVQCVVLTSGMCGDITVLNSLDPDTGLDQQAINSVKEWRFKPGTKDGKPVDVRVHIDVQFTLK